MMTFYPFACDILVNFKKLARTDSELGWIVMDYEFGTRISLHQRQVNNDVWIDYVMNRVIWGC